MKKKKKKQRKKKITMQEVRNHSQASDASRYSFKSFLKL